MSEYLGQFFDYFLYSAELLLSSVVLGFVFHKKNKYSVLILFLFFLGCIVLSAILTTVFLDLSINNRPLYDRLNVIAFTLLAVPYIVYIFTFLKTTIWNKVFIFTMTQFTRNIVRKIYLLIRVFVGLAINDSSYFTYREIPKIWLLLYYPIYIVVVILLAYLVYKTFKESRVFQMNLQIAAVFVVLLGVIFFISPAQKDLGETDVYAYTCLLIADLGYSFVAFFLMFALIHYSEKKMTSNMLEKMMEDSQKEYALIKENVDLINLKCHDLRHQLRAANLSGNMDEQFVNETLKSIDIYDCQTKTGNETLDVILMDRKLHCVANKIQFTAVTDGSLISFMDNEDIISLFSNILENATNYENRIKNEEERFISLTVKKKHDFILIIEENSLSKDLIPEVKKDKNYHGFGLLSIESIANKYDGNVSIVNNNSTYKISIIIPAR